MRNMIKIIEAYRTCIACPSQWECLTDDNRPVYIRYRWGFLSVQVGEIDASFASIFQSYMDNTAYVEKAYGDSLEGHMTFEQLKEACSDKIVFDCEEKDPPSDAA